MFGSLLIAAALVATNAVPGAVAAETNSVPARIVTVWKQADRELRRLAVQLDEGTIDPAAAARRREAVGRAFARVCRGKGVAEATIDYWRERLGRK